METQHTLTTAVRGFHFYRRYWHPQENKKLLCLHESENLFDRFAIKTVKENGETVGHLPREISRVTKYVLDRGITKHCKVSSKHYRLSPLVHGGLEIQCQVVFKSPKTLPYSKLRRVYTLRFIGLLELGKSARSEGLCRLNRDDILGNRDTTRKDVFSAKMAEEIELQVVAAGLAGVSSLLLLASAARLRRRKKRKNREEWVSDLLSKREENGAYNQLMAELRVDDSNAFRRYLCMSCSDFEAMV